MPDTIFHKIIRKELPATFVYEDDDVVAINDIHPKAATHLLFIPKNFIASVADAVCQHSGIPGMLIEKARQFAKTQGIEGYRLQFNVGKEGGQEVPYIHLHFLSDRML